MPDRDSRKFIQMFKTLLKKCQNKEILDKLNPIYEQIIKDSQFEQLEFMKRQDPTIVRMIFDLMDYEKLEVMPAAEIQYYLLCDWSEEFEFLPNPTLYEFDPLPNRPLRIEI